MRKNSGNALIGLRKSVLARRLQEDPPQGAKTNTMTSKQVRHVHPAIAAVTLALLAIALVGTLTATGLLA